MKKKFDWSLCLFSLLFGLPFGAAGIVTIGVAVCMNFQSTFQFDWVEGDAIISTPLDEISQTRKEAISYRYMYDGKEYEGRGLPEFSVSGERANAALATVKGAIERGEQIRCFINPRRPESSTLVPPAAEPLSAGMGLMAIPFLGIGIVLVIIGFFSSLLSRYSDEIEGARQSHRRQPLKWRRDWAAGYSRHLTNPFIVGIPPFLGALVGGVWPALNALLYREPDFLPFLIALVVGLLLLYWLLGVYRTHLFCKGLRVEFDQALYIGMENRLRIISGRRCLPRSMKWCLSQNETCSSLTRKNKSTLVHDRLIPTEVIEVSRNQIELLFDIRYGNQTSGLGKEVGHKWLLKGKGPLLSIGPFELPVLDGGESSDLTGGERVEPNSELTSDSLKAALEAENIQWSSSPDRDTFICPPKRLIPYGYIGMAVGLGLLAFAIFCRNLAPGLAFKLMCIIPTGLMGAYFFRDGFRWVTVQRQFTIDSSGITIDSHGLFKFQTKRIEKSDIRGIHAKLMSGTRKRSLHVLELQVKGDAQDLQLSGFFTDRNRCMLVAEHLEQIL